jgi:hypothetical protein
MERFEVWVEPNGMAIVEADLVKFAEYPGLSFLLHYCEPLTAWRLTEASSGCVALTGESGQRRKPFLKDALFFMGRKGRDELERKISLALQRHGRVLNQEVVQ